jgi:hypothetical protein
MKKRKMLTILLLCLGIVGIASAVEVINIDINNYGNDTAYTGQGAYPGGSGWIVYYGGWGIAVGSQRSADLVNQGAGAAPSTYAEQVWIGDPGGHGYIGSGETLLGDGFINSNPRASGVTLNDPNIAFMGEGAYGGDFDVYVYGNTAGEFMLADGETILATQSVTGTVSGLVEGENYVVFENVPLGNPNMMRLYYSNEINGIQLISRKAPFAVIPSNDPNDNLIDARNYDVAFDTNARSGEFNLYGPDIANYVHYLDTGEYMTYDIVVDAAAEGQYNLSADFVTYWGGAGLNIYLDDNLAGTLSQTQHNEDPTVYRSVEDLPINLFQGTHTLRWACTQLYFDVVRLRLTYVGAITLQNCDDVYLYGLQPAGDLNHDCRVNMADFVDVAANWLTNYDPEAN